MLAMSLDWFWNGTTMHSMFAMAVPVLEKMVRPIIVYAFLIIVLRIFGKRELTNINPFDFVVLMLLANTLQNSIIGDDNTVSGGIIGAFTLLGINYMVVRFVFKHRRLDQLIEGKPTTLIEYGKMCPAGMARELLNEQEMTTIAHRQGFANLDEVETCVLEPGGTFFVQGKNPGTDEKRHTELLARLEELSVQVAELRGNVKRET